MPLRSIRFGSRGDEVERKSLRLARFARFSSKRRKWWRYRFSASAQPDAGKVFIPQYRFNEHLGTVICKYFGLVHAGRFSRYQLWSAKFRPLDCQQCKESIFSRAKATTSTIPDRIGKLCVVDGKCCFSTPVGKIPSPGWKSIKQTTFYGRTLCTRANNEPKVLPHLPAPPVGSPQHLTPREAILWSWRRRIGFTAPRWIMLMPLGERGITYAMRGLGNRSIESRAGPPVP